jgi:hypothetical protein
MTKNVQWSLCKVPVILVRVYGNLNFLNKCSKKILKYHNFMKIHPMGAELFHTERQMDRQTNTTKLTVAFRNFANAPKIANGFDRHLLRKVHSPSLIRITRL